MPTSITREAEGKGLKIKVGLANILNQSLETKERDGERQIQSISSRKENQIIPKEELRVAESASRENRVKGEKSVLSIPPRTNP